MSAANVFARPRKNGEDAEVGGDPNGEDGDDREKAGCDGERFEWSELYEGDREEMGTVRWLIFMSDDRGLGSGGSGGDSSGAGIGRPRAAAIIWCSVHISLKSLRPLQNGASRRSI